MSKVVVLKNEGGYEIKEVTGKLTLDAMYDWIGCSFIDIAHSFVSERLGYEVKLIFDEEFLLKNKPVPNKVASLLFGYVTQHNEVLCGNVIVAKESLIDGEYELTGFNDEELKTLEKCLESLKAAAEAVHFKVHEPRVEFLAW